MHQEVSSPSNNNILYEVVIPTSFDKLFIVNTDHSLEPFLNNDCFIPKQMLRQRLYIRNYFTMYIHQHLFHVERNLLTIF